MWSGCINVDILNLDFDNVCCTNDNVVHLMIYLIVVWSWALNKYSLLKEYSVWKLELDLSR